jgi:hypothetical protein
MNLTVYVPKNLEAKLRKRAAALSLAPGLYVQQIVRQELEVERRFSSQFETLAGSWDDARDAVQIVRDIKSHRTPGRKRATLR